VRLDWYAREPDLVEHEARVLELLAGSAHVAVPTLVAADERGDACDVPAVLMTPLPGRVDWDPTDMERFLRRLAEPLPVIHATRLADPNAVRPFEPYYLGRKLRPPQWTTNRTPWDRGIEVHGGPPPSHERRFIHRDYHPGNVLWRRGRVTGVVDWVNASRGAPEVDVAHCRVNLAGRFGIDVADRFLRLWQEIAGVRDYHPYWDLMSALDMDTASDANAGVDALIIQAAGRP